MSDIIIQAENLGKRYLLSHQARPGSYSKFSDTLLHAAKAPLRWVNPKSRAAPRANVEEFWALKDISFEIKRGEVVGIIGRNGAGKSTLLKILSRITEPTTGRITLNGRVASLLEVGTGFHPELTGRENIFLNGAILGMTKAEIRGKFDEIVAFAEIERFLDTPVKRYSSGMYVRLAFAVAAHLEPEILIVDEVLAVGDAQFQQKCLGKMQDVARGEGRTVLFVSHSLLAIQRLCNKGILLNQGKAEKQGDIDTCIETYLRQDKDNPSGLQSPDLSQTGLTAQKSFRFLSVACVGEDGAPLSQLKLNQPFAVTVTFELLDPIRDLIVGFALHSQAEVPLFASHNNDFGERWNLEPGRYVVTVGFNPNYLRPKHYSLSVGAIASGLLLCHIPSALQISVQEVSHDSSAHSDERTGELFIPMTWSQPRRVR